MKLLKFILIIFAIYFIRRFIQMYNVIKKIQEEQRNQAAAQGPETGPKKQDKTVVDADFKVVD